jgi:tRNA threonylcarbamoyladenosine biosynthesis protein TsaB
MSKYILAIETSSSLCSLALISVDNEKIKRIAIENYAGVKVHNKMLMPGIIKLLKDNNLDLKDLAAISCGVGPGSFTGLRIGCAAVQGLAYSLGIKIYTCSSLRISAQSLILKHKNLNNKRVSVILDAHADAFYIGYYKIENNIALEAEVDKLLSKDELLYFLKNNKIDFLIGDSAILFKDYVSDFNKDIKVFEDVLPTADALGELVLTLDLQEPEELEIKYLRGEGHWRRAD